VVTTESLERLQRDCRLEHRPTELTYQLRQAVHREASEYEYEWRDKPHRLVYRACAEIERQAQEIERLRAINAELVTAVENYFAAGYAGYETRLAAADKVRVALARAKEQPQ
jgi:hypothetical protein